MLAAWMRMKFPNVVDAAVASSAPVDIDIKRIDIKRKFFRKIKF